MILFVFEGGKAEPTVFDSIGKLFLPNEELCVVKCRHDLPTLYSNLRANGYDLFRSLPFEDNGVVLPKDKRLDTLFSQVFLFFDYDFQNRIGTQKVNNILDEMLTIGNMLRQGTSAPSIYSKVRPNVSLMHKQKPFDSSTLIRQTRKPSRTTGKV